MIDAAMVMVILVLMVQMWLLTATLESYLAGHRDVALPALLSPLVLFGAWFFLYRLSSHRLTSRARGRYRPFLAVAYRT